MKSYKLELFKFLGAPVSLDVFFLIVFVFLDIKMAIALFISILIHEMAHAWMANKKGYAVYGIEISLFKGSAYMQPPNQRDSIPITFAGPLSNLLLFIISALCILLIGENYFLYSFSFINLFLFIFNMLPIYPMDGGHLVRDILMLNMNRKKGKLISIKISLITSILLFIFSIYFQFIIMILFSIYFIYTSYKSLKDERN
jgi:Zn-dependent protease